MSTRSKSSQTTGGCCTRTATLSIDFWWAMDVQPPALLFPSWDSRYLTDSLGGTGLKSRIEIISNASDECKEVAQNIIISRMVQSMNTGFRAWKRIATIQQKNLFEFGGTLLPVPFTPYDQIKFNIEPESWDFEIECCDELGVASIKSFRGFPRIFGFQAKKDWSGGLPGWDGPALTPRIIGAPFTH